MLKEEKKFDLTAETARVILRPLTLDDYESWFSGFDNRLPAQHLYDDGQRDMSACTPSWFADLVSRHQQLAVDDKAHIFAVFRKTDGNHLGMIDFSTLIRDNFQWARFGYVLHNQYWRQGYGKEAVACALNLAFTELGFHRIEAHINVDNVPSIKLAESAGMSYECTREGFIYEFGKWTNNLVYYINSPYHK